MIDWRGLARCALWVSGLALILATLSAARWWARSQGRGRRALLGPPGYQAPIGLGLLLVAASLAWGARGAGERAAWAALAALCAGVALSVGARAARQRRLPPLAQHPSGGDAGGSERSAGASRQEEMGGEHSERTAALSPDRAAARRRRDPRPGAPTLRCRMLTWAGHAELGLVLAAQPFLLFPSRHAAWALAGIGSLCLLRLATGRRLAAPTPVEWPMLGLLLWLPVAVWASADPPLTWPALCRLLGGMALFQATVNWASTPKRLALVAALVLAAGVGLAGLSPIAVSQWPGPQLVHAVPGLTRLAGREKALLAEDVNPNVLGGGLAVLVPFVAALLLARCASSRLLDALLRAALALPLLATVGALVLTACRGGLVAAALGLALMGFVRWPRLSALLLVAGAAALALRGVEGVRLTGLLLAGATAKGWDARQEIWSRAVYMIQDFGFTGIGLGTFDRVQPVLYPFSNSARKPPHAHNLFLQVAVDLGLPGLVAYLALLMGAGHAAWQGWQHWRASAAGRPGTLALGLLGSVVALAAHGMIDAALWANKLSFLPWLLMGLCIAQHRVAVEAAGASQAHGVGEPVLFPHTPGTHYEGG